MNSNSSEAFHGRMESQKFKFSDNWNCFAKSSLVRDLSVPAEALRIYLILQQVSAKGYCSMSNANLSEVTGIQLRTLQRCLAVLRNKGWITVQIFNNRMRKIFVRTDQRETAQNLEYIDAEFDKRPDCNKEDGTQFGDNENESDTNTEEQNEARDADTGEEIVPFEAQKSVQQAELIPPETECGRGTELATTGAETAVVEDPKDIFERTLWKHPETAEIIKERGSNKAMSFKRWCKLTDNGKRREVCDLLRTKYREMADARKRDGLNWNALEVFLNATSKRWETDWDKAGGHGSAFANTAPRGVTVLNRTTTRTAAQVTALTATGVADAKVATETVSETATVLGGDDLHLRDDYQKGTIPRDWVTLAVEKKLSGLNLSKGIVDSWRKITNWKFCPKELKQAVASLYDEGFRFDPRYDKVVTAGYEEDLAQHIAEHAAFLAHDENLDWLIYEKAKKYFDADNNFVFDTDLLIRVFKPAEECVEFVSFDAFDGEDWLKKNAVRLVKNDVNFVKRLLGKIKQLSLACNGVLPTRTLPTEQKQKSIQPIGSVVKSLTTEPQQIPEEPKPTEPEKTYPTDDDFQKHTKPKFWFSFLKKYAKNYETKNGMSDMIRDMTDWDKFPEEMMSFLRLAFRATKGGLSCIGTWTEFRMKKLYLMAEEENAAQGA